MGIIQANPELWRWDSKSLPHLVTDDTSFFWWWRSVRLQCRNSLARAGLCARFWWMMVLLGLLFLELLGNGRGAQTTGQCLCSSVCNDPAISLFCSRSQSWFTAVRQSAYSLDCGGLFPHWRNELASKIVHVCRPDRLQDIDILDLYFLSIFSVICVLACHCLSGADEDKLFLSAVPVAQLVPSLGRVAALSRCAGLAYPW